ncbi:MAG: hypothetical protein ACLGIK_04200, partial [Gemmatimonadota bacterium]
MLLRRAEFHTFSADGAPHVYLIPSAAVFRLDAPSVAVLDTLADEDLAPAAVAERLADRFPRPLVQETVDELLAAQAIRTVAEPRPAPHADGARAGGAGTAAAVESGLQPVAAASGTPPPWGRLLLLIPLSAAIGALTS